MKCLAILAVLAGFVACRSNGGRAETASQPTRTPAAHSIIKRVFEVVDKESGARVGLVEQHEHDTGETLYWVKDADNRRRGFILENNRAYGYETFAGERSEEPTFLGADTITAGARRVLGYGRPVRLEQTTLRKLAQELEQPAASAASE